MPCWKWRQQPATQASRTQSCEQAVIPLAKTWLIFVDEHRRLRGYHRVWLVRLICMYICVRRRKLSLKRSSGIVCWVVVRWLEWWLLVKTHFIQKFLSVSNQSRLRNNSKSTSLFKVVKSGLAYSTNLLWYWKYNCYFEVISLHLLSWCTKFKVCHSLGAAANSFRGCRRFSQGLVKDVLNTDG